METLLKVEDLAKHFPVRRGLFGKTLRVVRAVDGVSFELVRGETLSLVGESGCGKSTAARLILRLIEPTRGQIWFQGQDITQLDRKAMRPLRRSMQIIFQDPFSSLNPRMTVKDVIGEGLKLHARLGTAEQEELILETLTRVGLRPEHLDRYPHEFSGGQRQRIGIARAIIVKPKLIVADEPLSALDVSIQAQVINLLESLKTDFGLSYLFISHDLSVVEHVSDRIAVMYLGRIVEIASRNQLRQCLRHPYTKALFSAVPQPRFQTQKKRIILKGDVPSPLSPPLGCCFHPRCHYSKEICTQLFPPLRETEPGHWVACHFPLENTGGTIVGQAQKPSQSACRN